MRISRRTTLQLAATAAFAVFGRPAFADAYPSRVVRLFVGFPPGGGADLATRIVANGLSELWHQQVVGSPGIGTVPHLAGELFKHRAGIEITHVPYRGVNQGLMSDFLAGRLDLMFNTTGSLLEPVRSKQVRGLAVTSAKRFPDEPELPTVAESGVPGYDVSSWYAIYVPAKTPPDVVARINADMAAMLNEPAIKDRFKLLGVLPRGSTPQELAAMNVADAALWGPIIKEANIKVE
jgi:tripartite-type tricarboxylate transporter receptor subunit TctC